MSENSQEIKRRKPRALLKGDVLANNYSNRLFCGQSVPYIHTYLAVLVCLWVQRVVQGTACDEQKPPGNSQQHKTGGVG